jgi:hypothetical protein
MTDPDSDFDALLEAMLTKPAPGSEQSPEDQPDLREGDDD